MRAPILWFMLLSCSLYPPPAAAESSAGSAGGGNEGRGRSLLGFRETRGNTSFQCSPSGPCIPCLYSEKNDKQYRCSETGYRVPLNCVEIQESSKKTNSSKERRLQEHEANPAVLKHLPIMVRKLKWRMLLDDSVTSGGGKQTYITYRSCVPVDGEEILSIIGFEMIMIGLLFLSGPIVYMRQRRASVMPGVGGVRIPSNPPRF